MRPLYCNLFLLYYVQHLLYMPQIHLVLFHVMPLNTSHQSWFNATPCLSVWTINFLPDSFAIFLHFLFPINFSKTFPAIAISFHYMPRPTMTCNFQCLLSNFFAFS